MICLIERISVQVSGGESYLKLLQFAYQKFPVADLVRPIFNELVVAEGRPAAVQFLLRELSLKPTAEGLQDAIDKGLYGNEDTALVSVLSAIINREEQVNRVYRCTSCGFGAHKWHWQCPTCHHWDSMSYASESGVLGVNRIN